MTNKHQERIASAFVDKGFRRNDELSTPSYVTLENDDYSVYVSRLGELAWESVDADNVGAEKIFQPVWRVAGP